MSTNGDRHGHPHPEGGARILANKRTRADLYFNCLTDHNKMWLDAQTCSTSISPHYPEENKTGMRCPPFHEIKEDDGECKIRLVHSPDYKESLGYSARDRGLFESKPVALGKAWRATGRLRA